ncbi:MAG: TIGR03915 family putative DNA repair protein [Clostridiaceae bacterium]
MIIYVYDGTFEGLLTAIYDSYYSKEEIDEIVRGKLYKPSFLYSPNYIQTNLVKFNKVKQAIIKKISKNSMLNIYYCFLAETLNCDNLIYKYVKLGFTLGKDVDMHLHNDDVRKIHELKNKVSRESVRMLEFIRFKFVENSFYYAAIEPDYDILPLIAEHFTNRFSDQNFIINDMKREIALVYNKDYWYITELKNKESEKLLNSKDVLAYENLWKEYFKSIAIKERTNKKLQKNHMPSRYWKHILEMKDEL